MEETKPIIEPKPAVQPVPSVLKKFPKLNISRNVLLGLAVFLIVLLGVVTGWLLSGGKGKSLSGGISPQASLGAKEAGLKEEKGDNAEGILNKGGIDGEGNYHLVREGGDSQNVYLVSTVIDLEAFEGKKVKVWGETISGKKAGWLMDVTKIRVID